MQYSEAQDLFSIFSLMQNTTFKSVKTSLQVLEAYEQLEPIEARRLAVQNKLVQQYGELNDDGVYSVDPSSDAYFEFVKAFNELQSTEVEIIKSPLNLSDLENVHLTPNQLKSLRLFVTI